MGANHVLRRAFGMFVVVTLIAAGSFYYWTTHHGYHGPCLFQTIAVDGDGSAPLPDYAGKPFWSRDPDDGYRYTSPDCSTESKADSQPFTTVGEDVYGAGQPTGNHG